MTKETLIDEWHRLGIGGDNDQIRQAIDKGVERGWVEEADGALVATDTGQEPLIDHVDGAFDDFIAEYNEVAKGEVYDSYQHAGFKEAFRQAFRAFARHSVAVTLDPETGAQVEMDELRREVKEAVSDSASRYAARFAAAFTSWLEKTEGKAFGVAASSLFILTLTLQLLEGHNLFGKATRQAIGKSKVFLDANFVIHYLCPNSSPWAEVATGVLDICRKHGVAVAIGKPHLREVREVLRAACATMADPNTSSDWPFSENRFILEFVDGPDLDPSGFCREMESQISGIEHSGVAVEIIPDGGGESAENVLAGLRRCHKRRGSEKKEKALERDARVIYFIRGEQADEQGPFPSPWFLTLDRTLAICEDAYADARGETAVAILAGQWFSAVSGFLAFSDAGFDLEHVASAWLAMGMCPKHRFTTEDVVTVIAAGHNIHEEDKRAFIQRALKAEVLEAADKALARHDIDGYRLLLEEVVSEGMLAWSDRLRAATEAEANAIAAKKRMAKRLKDHHDAAQDGND